jgi:hypothetical protein
MVFINLFEQKSKNVVPNFDSMLAGISLGKDFAVFPKNV